MAILLRRILLLSWLLLPSLQAHSITAVVPATRTRRSLWRTPPKQHNSAQLVSTLDPSTTDKNSDPQSSQPPNVSYDDLTLFGKIVAGTVETAVSTALEYLSGWASGYCLGALTDLPRLVGTPVPEVRSQVAARFARLHSKSSRWAGEWAGISAVFGFFRVASKNIRGGNEDQWTSLLSSMAAGAYFRRKGT